MASSSFDERSRVVDKTDMKLHHHPFSSACQSVLLFCADANIPYEPVVVEVKAGDHIAGNLSAMIPVVENGDFVLAGSGAILRYLADAFESELYPKELQLRARVNERLDWFQCSFYREFGPSPVYPQHFPQYASAPLTPTPRGGSRRDRAERLLVVLEQHVLGGSVCLAGDSLTIADYFAAPIFAVDELVDMKLDRFQNVHRWLKALRERPAWREVYDPSGTLAAAQRWDWRSGYGAATRRSAVELIGILSDTASGKEPR